MNRSKSPFKLRLVALLAGVAAVAVSAYSGGPTPAIATAAVKTQSLQFTGAAPSIDALLDQLLQAVMANDEQSLHRLRVTESEYLTIIVPWTVEEGRPARTIPEQSATFYWRMLDAKSRDMARLMLQQFGGKKLQSRQPEYTNGVQKYGGYTAYGQVRLPVVNEQGKEALLRSGTIAEVAGGYKFIGLNWND